MIASILSENHNTFPSFFVVRSRKHFTRTCVAFYRKKQHHTTRAFSTTIRTYPFLSHSVIVPYTILESFDIYKYLTFEHIYIPITVTTMSDVSESIQTTIPLVQFPVRIMCLCLSHNPFTGIVIVLFYCHVVFSVTCCLYNMSVNQEPRDVNPW